MIESLERSTISWRTAVNPLYITLCSIQLKICKFPR